MPHLTTHGMTYSREYIAWRGMKSRCKTDAYYLEHGITYDPIFEKFEPFYAEIGDKPTPEHTLDRIDPNKGYVPGNIRWATHLEQIRNRKDAQTMTHNGVTKSIKEWAEEYNLPYRKVWRRHKRGLPFNECVSPKHRV